jgi:hypothetical protein
VARFPRGAGSWHDRRVLEIIFLIWFVRKLSGIATEKGRSGGWGGLGALFWIGGEILGGGIGFALEAGPAAYLLALMFAAGGAVAAYAVVRSLGPGGFVLAASGGEAVNPHYDPSNPYSPPRGGDPPSAA